MPRKSKVAQSLRSTRGLGYLPVILLVASALIVGAGHEPLQHLAWFIFTGRFKRRCRDEQ